MYLKRKGKIIIDYGIDIKIFNITNINAGGTGEDDNSFTKIGVPANMKTI